MDKLKDNANNIEFLLLFIPLAYIVSQLLNVNVDAFDLFIWHGSGWMPTGLADDGAMFFGIFGPFVLWKVFAKYHLK
jgi:hypothetical protein